MQRTDYFIAARNEVFLGGSAQPPTNDHRPYRAVSPTKS
ncbi:hypothetical protein B0G76_3247 [Paraburkholderia sp. BL23I1N1]|nr:hypothetical protein B0G76_3247 [Paraburkholderia sp. BL23I1N1]